MVRLQQIALTAVLFCIPAAAQAQVGSIAGTARDGSGGVLPGVTVEVTSPALIEKVRVAITDEGGRYQVTALPVGIYAVTFKLALFATLTRGDVELTSDFTALVNAEMQPGAIEQVIVVRAESPVVDVRNATQRTVFTGEEIRDMPTTRNLSSIVNMIPGIALENQGGVFNANSIPTICSGGAADGAAGVFGNTSTSGGLSGCSPILNGFNAHSSMNDGASLLQGRVQVDGMGIQSVFGGGRSSYLADLANAKEVSFTLGGGLGESETGGTTINVVPRTGGNRYAGQYFTSYASGRFFDRNDGSRPSAFVNRLDYDYDVNGAIGGPILRDRLWFHSVMRQQSRQSLLTFAYRNRNEGVFGANYVPDEARPVLQDEMYRNVNTRLTYQATRRNKFNLFWDEQYTCENPCDGTSSRLVSQEAAASVVTYPIHLAQISWTNPWSSRLIFEGGVSHYSSHVDQTRNRFAPSYQDIPRIAETGATTPRGEGITSGSINNGLYWNNDNIQPRASASYVSGRHTAKVGFQGGILSQHSQPRFNSLRLSYAYATPAATCVAGPAPPSTGTWCGLNLANAADPFNTARLPVPTTVTQYIPVQTKDRVWFGGFYAQDKWSMNRFTIDGALRYDVAQSNFPETCVGPDVFTSRQFCMNRGDGEGVSFQDITPRLAVTWDALGTGRTAVKASLGKYLGGAGLSGIYTDANAARRIVNSYARTWTDLDGDRIPDCDLSVPAVAPNSISFPNSGECGAISNAASANTARRFGRSPEELDEANQAIGLGTTQCGRTDSLRIPQAALDYCAAYFADGGETLLKGWGKRRYEWQTSIGVQHQLMTRLSVEVTYNRREIGNQTITDLVGVGCDLYLGGDPDQCIDNLLDFRSPFYDFYAVRAPSDPNLPGGGGYVVPGLADRKPGVTVPTSTTNAVVLSRGRIVDLWRGIDTSFTWRMAGGLRVSGGTSTGARYVNNCRAMVNDPPNVSLREGRERACEPDRLWQTNLRGTASYTIPRADVLVSAVFSVRPGTQINANYEIPLNQIEWQAGAESRATNTVGCGTATAPNPGCLLANPTGTTVTTNLLSNDTYGERITLFDMKIAKNFRFGRRRINVGIDLYNTFNSDAALQYCGTYPQCNLGGTLGTVPWRAVTGITTPRFARFQTQVDF
jgi:hypothetical protein